MNSKLYYVLQCHDCVCYVQAFPNLWCGNCGIYTVLNMYFNQLIFSSLALSVCQVLFPFKVALYSFFLVHEE